MNIDLALLLNAAQTMLLEDRYGSISIGKVANFTILDKNPLNINPLEIKNIKVQGTFSRGNYFPISLQK